VEDPKQAQRLLLIAATAVVPDAAPVIAAAAATAAAFPIAASEDGVGGRKTEGLTNGIHKHSPELLV
jgi:hypothetical protein